jgi:hypothetical protein
MVGPPVPRGEIQARAGSARSADRPEEGAVGGLRCALNIRARTVRRCIESTVLPVFTVAQAALLKPRSFQAPAAPVPNYLTRATFHALRPPRLGGRERLLPDVLGSFRSHGLLRRSMEKRFARPCNLTVGDMFYICSLRSEESIEMVAAVAERPGRWPLAQDSTSWERCKRLGVSGLSMEPQGPPHCARHRQDRKSGSPRSAFLISEAEASL